MIPSRPTEESFYEISTVGPSSITDGLSTTIAISETIRSDPGKGANDLLNGYVPPGFQVTRGGKWHYGAPGHSMYNHRRPPNDPGYDCRGGLPHSNRSDPLWSQLSLNIAARGRHTHGVNSLFRDGHVQFIRNSVNPATWRALGSRNGTEATGTDSH